MRATCTFLGMVLVLSRFGGGAAGDEPKADAKANTNTNTKAAAARTEDAKAIRGRIEEFVRAYDKGDAKAVAALFTDDARVVDEEGGATEGRAAIATLFEEVFAANPGAKIEVATAALRFLGPDAAEEEGRTTLTPAGGEPEHGRYAVIFVKKDGHWLQASVRDLSPPPLSTTDRLKELEWLVGEWVSESESGVVLSDCRWAEGKNFLLRAFALRVKGRPAMTGTQMIGWDPLTEQIRSWTFDSQGGFAEGHWARKGNEWVVKTTGVLRDGQTASATQIVTYEGKNKARWRTVDRTLGARALDHADEIVLVRKPPAPK